MIACQLQLNGCSKIHWSLLSVPRAIFCETEAHVDMVASSFAITTTVCHQQWWSFNDHDGIINAFSYSVSHCIALVQSSATTHCWPDPFVNLLRMTIGLDGIFAFRVQSDAVFFLQLYTLLDWSLSRKIRKIWSVQLVLSHWKHMDLVVVVVVIFLGESLYAEISTQMVSVCFFFIRFLFLLSCKR